jgi:hypothetical protein
MKPKNFRRPRNIKPPQILPPGNLKPNSSDAVFIVQSSHEGPRLAVKAVCPGANIRYRDEQGTGHPLLFHGDNPLDCESTPTLGSEYAVADQTAGAHEFHVGEWKSIPYSLFVHERGVDSAEFNWDTKRNVLLACQCVPSDCAVFFTRSERFDEDMYAGDIKIKVISAPEGYAGSSRLYIPEHQENGCWDPGVEGSYRVRVLSSWSQDKFREDTGSNEGEIMLEPPPGQ